MAKFFQLLHTLSYGDAISSEALALKRLFSAAGESDIYALNIHPRYRSEAKLLADLPALTGGNLVLHYSIGSPLNEIFQNATAMRRTLIFHNLTPSRWFEGVNPRLVEDINIGAKELPELCHCADLLLADSKYNASELNALGFPKTAVLELPVDPNRWEAEANPGFTELIKSDKALHLLHVGRLAPNKRIEDILKITYYLKHHGNRKVRLWLVGIDHDTELYSTALKRLALELGIEEETRFLGRRSDEEVRALYENCHVYICMSEHEGFCLPVIEAMHFRLPVVAYASSALPDTIKYGGVLLSEKRFPEIAILVERLAFEKALREKVIEAGVKRVAELSYSRFAKEVADLFFSGPNSLKESGAILSLAEANRGSVSLYTSGQGKGRC